MLEENETKRGFGLALVAGSVVLALLLGGIYLLTQRKSQGAAQALKSLPFGPAEKTYAEHIHFLDLRMSRATNYLNQEFTFLYGVLSNDGNRTIREIEVTVEFRDGLNQIVLRDTQRLLGPRVPPLGGGFRRDLELSFEHVPDDWNRRYPTIRVTGLALED